MKNTIDRTHQLALANCSIIDKVLYKALSSFQSYYTPDNLSDLKNEGYIALYKAAKNFKEEKGSFATFAYICVKNHLMDYIQANILLTFEKNENPDADLDEELYKAIGEKYNASSSHENIFFTSINDLVEDNRQYAYSADYVYDTVECKFALEQLNTTEQDIFANKSGVGLTNRALSTQQLADKYGYTTQHVNRLYRSAEQKVISIIQSA